MEPTRKQLVDQAVQTIKEFRRSGLAVIAKSKDGVYGKRIVEQLQGELGINHDTLRKARVFADEEKGYSKREMEELLQLIREHAEDADNEGSIFGRSHLLRLLSVPKSDRGELQELVVTQGWSNARLDAEIAHRYGRRKSGGRKRDISDEGPVFLAQLEVMCESWLRWRKAVVPPDPQKGSSNSGKTLSRKELDRMHKRIKLLPPSLVALITKTCSSIEVLQSEVKKELKRQKRSRTAR
jgi:hypothetical protein